MSPQNSFYPFPPKVLLFSKKWSKEKIFKTSFVIKKVIFIFVARHLLPFKRDLALRNSFWPFSQIITAIFFFKLLNNKIFTTSFVIKKVTVIFNTRHHLSLKNCQMRPQNSFSWFSQKILFFSKKLLNKKIFSV